MEIKQRITIQFTSIVALLLIASLSVIYLLFASYRKDDFKDRLNNKALSVAQLIAETEDIEPSIIQRLEKNNPTSLYNEIVFALNDSSEILYTSGNNNSISITDELLLQIRNSGKVYIKHNSNELVGHYYTGNSGNVIAICSAMDVFGFRKLATLRVILIVVFILSLVFIFFLGKLFASRALNPISDIIQQVNYIDSNNLKQRVSAGSGKDEISNLANTFNNMLRRLEHSFEAQKEFIANASHELRTPLTSITGNLEVTLLKERSNEEYKQSIALTLDEVKNLNRLSNRLLTLLRTGTATSDNTFSVVRIDDVLWKARFEHLKKNKKHDVQIHFDDSIEGEKSFQYKGNAELLKTAFLNLIDNGCKYSFINQIEIQLSIIEGILLIEFNDAGIGIPEDEIGKICQPFYRASNVKKQKGHGIGMSLVERIIGLHKGKLDIESSINKGTTIKLSLPLHPIF